jgi:hypothetical protein
VPLPSIDIWPVKQLSLDRAIGAGALCGLFGSIRQVFHEPQ